MGDPPGCRAAVLVEGGSDRVALETLAARLGRDLPADGVRVLAMGGATNVTRFLTRYGPLGRDVRITGLCDEAEEPVFRRGCARAGLGSPRTRDELERLGFFVCVRDLEDELIRALGVDLVERVIEQHGELVALRTLQQQPAQRARGTHQQLRRFLGSRSGRKAQYARLLVEAMDLRRTPAPLVNVLRWV